MTYQEYANLQLEESGMFCGIQNLLLQDSLQLHLSSSPAVFPTIHEYEIYVATSSGGIYYTNDFVSESVQPTWTEINSGLDATDCLEFHLDPFHKQERQYVVINYYGVYRREGGGAWSLVLSFADCDAILLGPTQNIKSVFPDPTIDGRVWATVETGYNFHTYYAVYSNDYGDTWNATTMIYSAIWGYSVDSIVAYGDNVWVKATTRDGGWTGSRLYTSSNRGSTWQDNLGPDYGGDVPCGNPLETNIVYTRCGAGIAFYTQSVGGTFTLLRSDIRPDRIDCMWFDPLDTLHQRLIYNNKLYVTEDGWGTINSPSTISPSVYSMSPWFGDGINTLFLGLNTDSQHIAVISEETDITATGISGGNCGTPPYTNSIPATSGDIANHGIQVVLLS